MLITILAGVFILSVVIVVHEFGHFIVAKKLGVFVKVFSVGFGRKVIKKRWGETVYAISMLPFGGYVKFAGESEDVENKEAPQGEETDEISDSEIDPDRYFINKRPLVRSAVVFAGPFANYVLAIVLYVTMFAVVGVRVLLPTTTIGRIGADSPADSVGLEVNDKIIAVGNKEVTNWEEVVDAVWEDRENVVLLTLERGEETLEIDFKCRIEDNRITLGFYPHVSALIGQVKRGGPAYHAGIRPGATIDAIGDTVITSFYDIERIIHGNPEIPMVIRWSRDGVQRVDTITPVPKKTLKQGSKTEFEIVGQIGVGPQYNSDRVPFHRAVVMGFNSSNQMITEILSFLKLLFTGKTGIDALGGPILITQMAGDMAKWGFQYLIYFLAFFSINLCIFNLLPILPFDGGHLALFFIEGVTRRRVNRRLKDLMTQGGFVLLILLMVFVVVIDLSRCAGSSPAMF